MSDIKAPAYAVPPLPDARGGDSDWMIGALWGLALIVSVGLYAAAFIPLSAYVNRGPGVNVYAIWRITPGSAIGSGAILCLAGAIQFGIVRRWLPLSRWWIAAVLAGNAAAMIGEYLIDSAADDAFVRHEQVVMHNNLPLGLGWLLAAAMQALLLGRFSRRAWGWLVPPLAGMALAWLGADLLGAAAYLLLGMLALPWLLRAAPEPEAVLG